MFDSIVDLAISNAALEAQRQQAILLGVTADFFCGLIPLTMGFKHSKIQVGIAGLFLRLIGGYWFGLLAAVPLAVVFSKLCAPSEEKLKDPPAGAGQPTTPRPSSSSVSASPLVSRSSSSSSPVSGSKVVDSWLETPKDDLRNEGFSSDERFR